MSALNGRRATQLTTAVPPRHATPPLAADQVPTVAVTRLSRSFDRTPVLDGLDLTIVRGEFVALLGRSGSGKSTLLRALGGLDPGARGQVTVAGTVAVAFQEPRLLPWLRVWRNVILGYPGERPRYTAHQALDEVGLAGRASAWPLTLSGGQAQRVALARALVREPDLLLLDEPFGALDALTRISAQRLVADLWIRHRPAVLLVTHDADEALLLADRVLVLDGGRIRTDLAVTLPRPRRRAGAAFDDLRSSLLADLGVDDPSEGQL